MIFFIILITIEILSIIVFREYFKSKPAYRFYLALVIHIFLSAFFWIILIRSVTCKGYFDNPANVANRMNLTGMICGVLIPRFLFITIHYLGKLVRIRKGGYVRLLTKAAMVFSLFIFLVIGAGTFYGRYNYRTEEVKISYTDLPRGLEGLRIVQISDMHLSSFFRHEKQLERVISMVNSLKPDILINTGDFVSYGWREFDRFDTILSRAVSRYGNFAIFGNHDAGTYMPGTNVAEKEINISKISELVRASGYHLLRDDKQVIEINGTKVAFAGVTTGGRHPFITHGDLNKALAGTDSADFRILLAHDPNQWEEEIKGKTNVELTLSGHTHGMQIGIITKGFRWSPSKYYYPHWNGLYGKDNQFLYVNRGLGVLAIPFRIWMPPEITLITLSSE